MRYPELIFVFLFQAVVVFGPLMRVIAPFYWFKTARSTILVRLPI
jgi:hypothetical protein